MGIGLFKNIIAYCGEQLHVRVVLADELIYRWLTIHKTEKKCSVRVNNIFRRA